MDKKNVSTVKVESGSIFVRLGLSSIRRMMEKMQTSLKYEPGIKLFSFCAEPALFFHVCYFQYFSRLFTLTLRVKNKPPKLKVYTGENTGTDNLCTLVGSYSF